MTKITYQPVTSSNIGGVAFVGGRVFVEFLNGRRAAYGPGIDRAVFDKMLEAKSIGLFFAKEIKGAYPTIWLGWKCACGCGDDATHEGIVAGQTAHVCLQCSVSVKTLGGVQFTKIKEKPK